MFTSYEARNGDLRARRLSAGPFGPAWFALSVASAVIVFWSGFASLVSAWSLPEYSHGPIIPLISLFLFLREMRSVPPTTAAITDRWPGVAVVLLGLIVGIMGELARVSHIVTYGFMIWIAGMVLVCFGLRRGVLFWPAIVHLVFMLPLPTFIYWQVSSYLQTISSQIGVWLISMVGIPVYLDGNIIDLGVYKLQVAEACSGLRYLFPMLSFSYVFGVLYQGPRWHKVVLLLAAAPITVAMNSFRIGMIGVLVDNFGIEQAEGFLHSFEGWIIFLACVAILFAIAALLQRLTPAPKPLSETIDIEFVGLGAQLRRVGDIAPSRALIGAALLSMSVAIGWFVTPERAVERVARDPFVVFPTKIGDWRGQIGMRLDTDIERVLGADDYLSINFARPDVSAPVDLFVAYYHDQMDGSGIHSPEVCIPAGGWEVSAWKPISITLPSGAVIETNRAVIQKGTARQLVYFWFDLRGRRIAGDFTAKAVNLWDSLTIGRSDGALVRLITPMLPGEDETAADGRLEGFMAEMSPSLPRFVPE